MVLSGRHMPVDVHLHTQRLEVLRVVSWTHATSTNPLLSHSATYPYTSVCQVFPPRIPHPTFLISVFLSLPLASQLYVCICYFITSWSSRFNHWHTACAARCVCTSALCKIMKYDAWIWIYCLASFFVCPSACFDNHACQVLIHCPHWVLLFSPFGFVLMAAHTYSRYSFEVNTYWAVHEREMTATS